MTAKTIFLMVLAVILTAAYVHFFTDLFRTPTIQIISQSRPLPSAGLNETFYFSFKGKQKLTSIKVIPVPALETNKYALPCFHLVSDSNSVPIKGFVYGGTVPGMKPAKHKSVPDNLRPNMVYRVFVEAGRAKGQIDFQTPPQ
ncbi:MAG: hypothetical protein AB1813_14585 [Verrucomicrobiota bacterium]